VAFLLGYEKEMTPLPKKGVTWQRSEECWALFYYLRVLRVAGFEKHRSVKASVIFRSARVCSRLRVVIAAINLPLSPKAPKRTGFKIVSYSE
jgi:hypothetical protein